MVTFLRSFPAIAVLSAVALAGCADDPQPTFGERVTTQGGAVAAIGNNWTEGRESVASGEALIREGRSDLDDAEDLVSKGEKRIRKARRQIERGERLVAEGERLQRQAEREYRQVDPRLAAEG